MYINRRTFNTKQGKQKEAIALLLEAQALIPDQTARITVPVFGPFNTLAVEFDFATLVDYERFWAEFWVRPDLAETLVRWGKLIETGGCNELWRSAE